MSRVGDSPLAPLAASDDDGLVAAEHPAALDADARATMARLVRRIARDERLAAERALVALSRATATRERLELAEVARDELRHQLQAEQLLERLDALREPRAEEPVPASLAIPGEGLAACHVSLALADRAAAVRYEALAACRWTPLARAARAMAADERRHAALGAWHVRRMSGDAARRDEVREAVGSLLGPTLDAFGIDDPPDLQAQRDAGLHVASASRLRERYLREVRELLDETRIAHPRWSPPWQGRTGAVAAASADPHLVTGG